MPICPYLTEKIKNTIDIGRNGGMINITNHTFFSGGVLHMKKPKGKYAWTATVGEKGQIVIPKQARELFDINPGDTVILLGDQKRGLAIPLKSTFADLAAKVFSEEE